MFFTMLCLLGSVALAQTDGYQVGEIVEDFTLKNIDGNMLSLADASDEGVIVVFTCNTCPVAQAYEDRIIALDQEFRAQGYPVLAIQPNDTERVPGDNFDEMVERAAEHEYPFPYVLDETQEIARRFGATRTPHVYLLQVQTDGSHVVQYIGAIDDNYKDPEEVSVRYVSDAIEALKAGETPARTETRAVGCTIKWAS